MNKKFTFFVILSLILIVLAAFPLIASAGHAWGNYHWERASNPLNLELGDNVDSNWDFFLVQASADWNDSTVLNTTVASGRARGQCRPTSGRVEVCNDAYGNNGWLGLAQIWISGDHITQGVAKMNDTYFALPQYDTPAERAHVMCQEIGHTFGLGHQDESGASLGTCMDYADDSTNSQHPNAHDYDQLEAIYAHLDSSGGGGGCNPRNPNCNSGNRGNAGVDVDLDNPSEWGQLVRTEGRTAIYERQFGNQRMITFVIWAN